MPRLLLPAIAILWLGLAIAAAIDATAAPARRAAAGLPVVRVDGIGPLRLGMTEAAARATGWLAGRTTGCELGGPPLPVVYRLTGPKAKPGIEGTVEFQRGKLRALAFTGGVRTTFGTVPGKTPVATMVSRYRAAGFGATPAFDSTFDGTFVTVTRFGLQRVGGFAEKAVVTLVGVPYVPVCE